MIFPTEPIAKALTSAALQTRVPVTLLAAIAYQESTYDPNAIGQVTKGGWRAMGLMQLSPAVMRDYRVTDAEVFDPLVNAIAGARLVAALWTTIQGAEWGDVIAAYFMGLTEWRRYKTLKRRLPSRVRLYVEAVQGNRKWLPKSRCGRWVRPRLTAFATRSKGWPRPIRRSSRYRSNGRTSRRSTSR